MILHRLEVGGFRCFSSKVALSLDPEQINILHGKNGSGKSSLLWALIRGLLDTHRAGGKSVEVLRPWGTDLGPTIVVDFEHEGKCYRMEKNFLENRCAHLSERQGNKLKPVAHNEKAEERVREILLSEAPTVGLTKPEKWGLARALWCPQEHLLVDGFAGRVLGNIQELLGKQSMHEDAVALQNRVEKLYLEYWTPQGKPKGGKDAPFWMKRQGDLPKLEEALADSTRELEELQAAQEMAQILHDERTKTQSRLEESQNALSELQARVAEFTPLLEKCGKLKAQCDAKRTEAGALDAVIKQIAALREKEECAAVRLAELDQAILESSQKEEGLQRFFEKAEQVLESLERGDPQVSSFVQLLEEAENYNAGRNQLLETQNRLQHVSQAAEEIRENKEELSGLAAPDDATLSTLNQLATKQVQLQAQLDGALLHVHLKPSADRSVEILQGSPLGPHQLTAGGDLHVSGSPSVELMIEGFGLMRVTGPASSAADLEQRLAQVTRQIDETTTRFGTTNLAELKNRNKRAIVLETQVAVAVKSQQQLLGGQTTETLRETIAQLQQQTVATEERQPSWKDAPPDVAAIRQQLDGATQAFEGRRSDATDEWKRVQTELGNTRTARAANERERGQLSKLSGESHESLLRLRADGNSDVERMQRFKTLSVEAVGLDERYKEELSHLQRLGDDPRPRLEQAKTQQETAAQAFQKNDRALHEHRGTLKKLLDRAPYERSARLEEEIGEIRAEIGRDKLRADALRLIRATISECEEQATAGVAGPISERASKLLHRIAGVRMGSISLSDDLAPLTVEPAEATDAIDLEHLSGGEREQVYVAVRLALAELLTKDAGRRELVVLDDVLTFTDDERLKRVFTILEEMRTHAQFLILTCHPDRYKPLKSANFIDLQKTLVDAKRRETIRSISETNAVLTAPVR